jgi:CRP/FNR family cyclic AMP-dependent transcriptional regulator
MREPTDCLTCEYRPHRMFCSLAPEALADFNSIGALAMHPAGATLIREGDPCRRILVLCTGQVMLSCNSSSGTTMNVRVALPGDVLGLSAAISNGCSEATAITMEPAFVNAVPRAHFLAFLARHGEASLHAAQLLAQEYRSSFEVARRLALSGSVAARLAGLLLAWGRSGSCDKRNIVFTMNFSHEAIAGFAGTSRESITRALGAFQKKELIRIHGSSVRILAEEKLSRIAS